MNDLERWINLQGPPPPDIRALFDAARDPSALSPEEWEDLDRRVFAAIEVDRRREARQRAAKRTFQGVAGLALLAACVAGALVLGDALRADPPVPSAARKLGAGTAEPGPPVLGANIVAPPTPAATPSVSTTSPPPKPVPVRLQRAGSDADRPLRR